MDWTSFQKIISILFVRFSALNFQFLEDKIEYSIENSVYAYTMEEFNVVTSKLSEYTVTPTSICSSKEIEIFVEPFEPRYGFRFQEDDFNISDNDVSYKIAPPSTELMIAFLSSIPDEEIRNYRRVMPSHMMSSKYLKNDAGDINLFDLIIKITRLSLSLKIKTLDNMSSSMLYKYANSLLFTLAYNTDTTFKIIHSLAELEIGRGRAMPRRNMRMNEIEPPKLFYAQELTEQYNLALTSSDPFVKFIAYYHIIEYFFDDVYSGALIKSVREILLHPGFSAKKTKEINKLIDVVRRKTKTTRDEFQGTELEALELTIKTFVSLEQLRDDLSNYNSDLVEYYRLHEISFSNGDTIGLNDFENDKLPKKIAARIYKTRNALVHNKSNSSRIKERGVYRPFKDDTELSQEMPLMRLIAEAIIVKSAEEI